MRIVLVTDGLSPVSVGGMQSHSTNLARSLAACGVNIDVVYPAHPTISPTEMRERTGLESGKIRAIPVAIPSMSFPGHYVAELWRYSTRVERALSVESRIDWIYVQGLCGMALLSGSRRRIARVAVNLHGLEMFQRTTTVRGFAEQVLLRTPARLSARRADISLSLGAGTSRLLRSIGVPASRIEEIPVGIDDNWVVDLPRPVRRIRRLLFVGRFERRKGIEELSAAIRQLDANAAFEFDFVGPIPAEHQIHRGGIRYWGLITDRDRLRQIMDDCDVLVCPSYAEGMPTVILEGMARGLAVIATHVGAVDELVSSSNGWLIDASDEMALRNAIRSSLSIPAEVLFEKKLASVAMVNTRFKWSQVAEKTARTLAARAATS
ncbi:MAG: glycosyltransferase family 4 protein [Gemmatimonadales bacterium]